MTRQEFMDFFRSHDGWADLTVDDKQEVFLDILQGDSDLTPDLLNGLIDNYGAANRLHIVEKKYVTLFILTMEDAELMLREIGHEPTPSQLDEMEHGIRKSIEWGLGDCWHDVMKTACEIAWEELRA